MPYVLEAIEGDGDRDGYGGRPYLRDGAWPVCRHEHFSGSGTPGRCTRFGQPLTHFMRFDVREEWKTPWAAGSHLSLFQCVACADAFIPPSGKPPWQLPAKFWARSGPDAGADFSNYGWWHATLEPPDAPLVRAEEPEPLVAPRAMKVTEGGKGGPVVGIRLPEGKGPYTCACGAHLELAVGIGDDYPFVTLPGAPEQRGTYSKTKYRAFLGNKTALLACSKSCDPRAVIPYS